MAALVTTPPNLIDPVGYSRIFSDEVNPMGIFVVGSAMYLVLVPDATTTSPPHPAAGVWKSTDGITWTEQDAANHPAIANPGYHSRSCTFNPATGIISILLMDNSTFELFIAPFDTATNLYSALSVASAALNNPSFAPLYQQSTGKLVAPTSSNVAAVNKLRELDLTAGVWSGPNQIGNILGPSVYGAVVDSSDRGHVFYADASFNLYYAMLDAGLTLGTPVLVATGADWDAGDIDQRIWNGKLVIAWTGGNILHVSIGDPLSGVAFTDYVIDTVPPSGTLAYPTLAEDKDGKLVVFVAYTDFSGSPYIDELSMWTFDGVSSWGSPVLFYDEIANPPANSIPDQTHQFIHTGAATQRANGQWVFATALELQPGGVGTIFCAGHTLVTNISNPLTLPCPIASPGTVDVPFTETLIASGGTPPYTYSLVMGYSLPPGLTLDPVTGIISGTPTVAGLYNIAFMVTDSLGATATTIGTCPIPINGPGGGGSGGCLNPGANPTLDSYLELRKVLVAWKKETHLPIRGKS